MDYDLDNNEYQRLLREYAEGEDSKEKEESVEASRMAGEGLVQELLRRGRKTPDYVERNLDGVTLVFVYGTLKSGGRLSSYMQGAMFLGEAQTTMGGWNMAVCDAEFPIALRSQKSSAHMFGEVYAVDTKRLATLDSVEDNGGMYNREQIFVTMLDQKGPDGKARPVVKVHTYVGNPEFWDRDGGLRFLPTYKGFREQSVLCFNQMQKSGKPFDDSLPF